MQRLVPDRAPSDGLALRLQLVKHIYDHADVLYNGLAYKDWVDQAYKWSMDTYLAEMSRTEAVVPEEVWGSALETGVAAELFNVVIRTMECVTEGYERISEACPAESVPHESDSLERIVCVLWNGTHYD